MLKAVIMCGGSGNRLWPLSTSKNPKQFANIIHDESLFLILMKKLINSKIFDDYVIVSNNSLESIVLKNLQNLNIQNFSLILEPFPKNTASAIALACHHLKNTGNSEVPILVLPSDHLIEDHNKLFESIQRITPEILESNIVTFGLKPTCPETGYGYIQYGENKDTILQHVIKFHEKPDIKAAEKYFQDGSFLWNSGIFYFKASAYLEETKKYLPQVYDACSQALKIENNKLTVSPLEFEKSPSISIDHGILEKTENVKVFPLDLKWSDLGCWNSFWKSFPKNEDGNLVKGNIHTLEVVNSLIKVDDLNVGVCGLTDIAIIQNGNNLLVSDLNKSQKVKTIAEFFQKNSLPLQTNVEYRPWGKFETLLKTSDLLIKKITVNPKSRLSLQSHNHRSEHWIVSKGIPSVQLADQQITLKEEEYVYIPQYSKHRLSNESESEIEIIEIQIGKILSEEDIIRYEDDYNRVTS